MSAPKTPGPSYHAPHVDDSFRSDETPAAQLFTCGKGLALHSALNWAVAAPSRTRAPIHHRLGWGRRQLSHLLGKAAAVGGPCLGSAGGAGGS